jgi:hypothetical protein
LVFILEKLKKNIGGMNSGLAAVNSDPSGIFRFLIRTRRLNTDIQKEEGFLKSN